jgi:predicted dehydrogenase
MLNVAVVGTGEWGKNLVRNFHEITEASLRICCDLNKDRLMMMKEKYPYVEVTTDYKEVLEDRKIGGIVIATSTPTHFDLAKMALQADKHVFVEKPLALDYGRAQELVDLARSHRKIIMVGHLLEYHPAVTEMKKRISRNELGEVWYVYSERLNLGKVRTMENALWCLAPHDISVVLYLVDLAPTEVSAQGESFLQKEKRVEDVVFINIRFEDGVLAHVHVSWLDPHKVRKMTLVGSKKMMVFDDMESRDKLKIFNKGVIKNSLDDGVEFNIRYGDVYIPKIEWAEPLRLECLHFIECVKENKIPRSDGEDGLRVVKVLEAAQESLDKGGIPVRMKESD